MQTYIWAIIGFILIAAELLTGTFILLFFGVAALIVALLKLVFLDSLAIELIIFSFLAAAGLMFFRKNLRELLQKNKQDFYIDKDSSFVLSADIPAKSEAKVLYQGSLWTACNDSDQKLEKGQKVIIVRSDSIKLYVTKS